MSEQLGLRGSTVGAVLAGNWPLPAVGGHVVHHVLLAVSTIALFPTSWTLNKETTDGATHRLQNINKSWPQNFISYHLQIETIYKILLSSHVHLKVVCTSQQVHQVLRSRFKSTMRAKCTRDTFEQVTSHPIVPPFPLAPSQVADGEPLKLHNDVWVKGSDMGLQISFPVGPMRTMWALERLLSRMGEVVPTQVPQAAEGTVTLIARMPSGDSQQATWAHTC